MLLSLLRGRINNITVYLVPVSLHFAFACPNKHYCENDGLGRYMAPYGAIAVKSPTNQANQKVNRLGHRRTIAC